MERSAAIPMTAELDMLVSCGSGYGAGWIGVFGWSNEIWRDLTEVVQ